MGQIVHRREDVLHFDSALRVAEDNEWWIRMADRAVFAWTNEVGQRVRAHDAPREGVDAAVRYRCRLYTLRRHEQLLRSDRQSLARMRRDVAAAALLAGKRTSAIRWSVSSLRVQPSLRAVKLLVRSVIAPHRGVS
jgi:hypothetical protein